jgi:hypothetical protein
MTCSQLFINLHFFHTDHPLVFLKRCISLSVQHGPAQHFSSRTLPLCTPSQFSAPFNRRPVPPPRAALSPARPVLFQSCGPCRVATRNNRRCSYCERAAADHHSAPVAQREMRLLPLARYIELQCCGSGIRCLFDPGIRNV